MLRSLKKAFIIIPCMVLAFVFFGGVSAFAEDARLNVDSEQIIQIGDKSAENTYYFTQDEVWSFVASYKIKKTSTFLKYRVIRPDGSATKMSSTVDYVNSDGKFSIEYKNLAYVDTVDMNEYTSIAKDSTYYVEITYYSGIFYWAIFAESFETIKIVCPESGESSRPNLNVNYNSDTQKYDVTANFVNANNEEVTTNVVDTIKYFFSSEKLTIQNLADFNKAYNSDDLTHKGEFTKLASPKAQVSIDKVDSEQKYLYVYAETPVGTHTITEVNLNTNNSDPVTPDKDNTNTNNGTGVFDYKAGELILLVLVVVLIVSCALIIAQKIVDYKKKLY